MYNFSRRYEPFENGAIHLYTDKALNPDFETEIFVDAKLTHTTRCAITKISGTDAQHCEGL